MKSEINLYNAYIFVFCFNYYRGFQRVVYIYIYIYIYIWKLSQGCGCLLTHITLFVIANNNCRPHLTYFRHHHPYKCGIQELGHQ